MKKLLLTLFTIVMTLGILFALSSCKDGSTVTLIKDGTTEYSLTYSSDFHEHYSSLLKTKIKDDLSCTVDYYEYGEKSGTTEIVIGDTDRQISKELKSAAEALKANDNDLVWAYGYKNGSLGFYAGSKIAAEAAWSSFISAVMNNGALECSEELWVAEVKSYEQYQSELKAQYELEDKAQKEAIVKKLSKFSSAYTSKWGADIKRFPTSFSYAARPTSSHPRVFVNEETLPTVIANLYDEENEPIYEQIKLTADAALSEEGGLAADGSSNYSVDALEKIQSLAFMYLVTGREKYGYSAILHSFNLINTFKLSDASYNNSNRAGTAIYMLAEVYDWCYDLLTPEQRTAFINGTCNNIAKYFEIGYPPPANAGAISGHSSELVILREWLAFGIAVYDEKPEIYNYAAGKIAEEFAPAINFFYASGVHHQGSSYGTTKRLYPVVMSDILMQAATGKKIYDADLDAMIMTHINRLRPDSEAIRIGDFHSTTTGYDGAMKMAFFAGAVYKNPIAKAWFEDANITPSYTSSFTEITPVSYLLFNDPSVIATDKYALELVHYNPAPSGSVVARSAWDDPNAWLTYTNVKMAYEGNHDHRDAGTFQIYYKGILAPDAAPYQYGSDQQYGCFYDRGYVKQTISKNGLLIYNSSLPPASWGYSGGQSLANIGNNADYGNKNMEVWQDKYSINQAAVLGYSSKTDNGELVYTYISGDITKAYDEATVDLVTRTTMTLATGDEKAPMAFIVYDRIISDSAGYEKSFVLHTTGKPTFGAGYTESEITSKPQDNTKKDWRGFTRVTGTNTFYYDNTLGPGGAYTEDRADDKYNGQLTVKTLLPENPTYNYVGGDGKRFWIDGQNIGNEYLSQYPEVEVGWGRVEITPSVQSKDDTFLNVMYVSDAGVTVTEEAQLIDGNTHDGVVTYGSCVMFAKAKECANTYQYNATDAQKKAAIQKTLIKDTVTFSTAGKAQSETLSYYVGGLAEGTWTVSVGSFTSTVEVTAEGTIAVFEAPVGEVTLTKA